MQVCSIFVVLMFVCVDKFFVCYLVDVVSAADVCTLPTLPGVLFTVLLYARPNGLLCL